MGNEASGKTTISDLKSKTKYSVLFGYEANKIVTPDKYYDIKHEDKFLVSTSLPANYSEATIIASLVLLLILIVIVLILLGVIFYWNNQRKKITGLSLMVNEEDESNDYYESNDHSEIEDYSDDLEQNIKEWSYE